MKILTKKQERKNVIEECWSLDFSLILWLNKHLKVYLEQAEKYIKMDEPMFTYKRKKYTHKQIVERLIELTDFLSVEDNYFSFDKDDVKKMESYKNEMYDLLKECHFTMWI